MDSGGDPYSAVVTVRFSGVADGMIETDVRALPSPLPSAAVLRCDTSAVIWPRRPEAKSVARHLRCWVLVGPRFNGDSRGIPRLGTQIDPHSLIQLLLKKADLRWYLMP